MQQQLGLLSAGGAVLAAPVKSKRHFDSGVSSEWYTPAAYIEAARLTMDGIDLDPASCSLANQTVQAASYFDREVDGLRHRWHGRVWLNPPYSDHPGQAARWAAKLLHEHKCCNVQQAVLLVNLSTSYQGAMQQIARVGAVCLVGERIRFHDVTGKEQRSPTQANVIYYLGERRRAFAENFGRFGAVLEAVR